MKPFTLTWDIGVADENKLLKEFLKEQNISKTALVDIKFRGGAIYLNRLPVTVRKILSKGDIVEIVFPQELPSDGLAAEAIPLNIIYEDEYVLVVDKPPHMPTIPSREHSVGSLANALLHYYQQNGIETTIHIVTRLDRDTSGLVLVAKHRYIHHLLSIQQKNHEINRKYAAIVNGLIEKGQGTIHAPIGRKPDSIIEREVHPNGQNAVTHFQVLSAMDSFTFVSLRLETGRTHQIRVHMAYLGHPLVGDDLYGGSRELIDRQALHSCELEFLHPILKKKLAFKSELPSDMRAVLNSFG